MGELLRRYWQPVALSEELPPERPAKAVRIMSEDLVLFMDPSGRTGLLADKCAHRSASLVYGRVEERGISCAYHGWLYDCEGNILETPPERNDAVMKNVKITAYPVEVYLGLIWAYMGPAPAPPMTHFDTLFRDDVHRKIADLKKLERVLKDMVSQCDRGDVPDCPVIDALFQTRAYPSIATSP